jgi:hypothetical protein
MVAGQDPFVRLDFGSLIGTGMAPRHRCIVSRDPLPVRVLLAALATTVSQRDELEIIVDRRRGGSVTNQTSIERRHPAHFAHVLERVGVAIVPARVAQSAEPSLPTSPIERSDRQDSEERQFRRLNEYKRRRKVGLTWWVVLVGLMGVSVALLVHFPTMKTLREAGQSTSHDHMTAPAAAAAVPQVSEPSFEKVSSATVTTTRPAARVSRRAAAAASPSASPSAERPEQPRATKGEAMTPERQEKHEDNPHAVIDWLLNR